MHTLYVGAYRRGTDDRDHLVRLYDRHQVDGVTMPIWELAYYMLLCGPQFVYLATVRGSRESIRLDFRRYPDIWESLWGLHGMPRDFTPTRNAVQSAWSALEGERRRAIAESHRRAAAEWAREFVNRVCRPSN